MIPERAFYARDTRRVARELLGMLVVTPHGRGRIVETEAYHGPGDQASHARRGPTPRARIMFGEPGHAYVYLIYGMHHCLNAVTGKAGFPSAVLIRAVDIAGHDPRAGAGPGKVCRALAIDRRANGADLTAAGPVWIEDDGERFPARQVKTGPRIGVDYAGAWADRPWRYWIAGHPAVSR